MLLKKPQKLVIISIQKCKEIFSFVILVDIRIVIEGTTNVLNNLDALTCDIIYKTILCNLEMKNSKIFASSLNEAPAVTAVLQRYICTGIPAIIYMYITDHVNVLSHFYIQQMQIEQEII